MDKSRIIKNKLEKLANDNKIQGLFLDDESEVSIILDLETIEYKGVYLKYKEDDIIIEINTAISSLKIKDGTDVKREKLDSLVRAHIDKVAVGKFNINKLDEDYFNDIEDRYEEKIAELNNKKTQKIYEDIESGLIDIAKSDYDYNLIKDSIKGYDIKEKSAHYILEKQIVNSKIKYNINKSKISIKNICDFKEKINLNDFENFDQDRLIEAIKEIKRKRDYHKKRLEYDDDDIDEEYPSYLGGGILAYQDIEDLDIDND